MIQALPSLFVIARHGESELNLLKGNGWAMPKDSSASSEDELATIRRLKNLSNAHAELTELGVDQAKKTGEGLRSNFGIFDLVIHTGYTRSKATAEHILMSYPEGERTYTQFIEERRFREREAGPTQYMTEDEAAQAFPWQQTAFRREGPFYFRPPFGESLSDLCDGRVRAGFQDLCVSAAGKRVLLIGHGRSNFCLRACIDRLTTEQIQARLKEKGKKNCNVTVYVPDAEQQSRVLKEKDLIFW